MKHSPKPGHKPDLIVTQTAQSKGSTSWNVKVPSAPVPSPLVCGPSFRHGSCAEPAAPSVPKSYPPYTLEDGFIFDARGLRVADTNCEEGDEKDDAAREEAANHILSVLNAQPSTPDYTGLIAALEGAISAVREDHHPELVRNLRVQRLVALKTAGVA